MSDWFDGGGTGSPVDVPKLMDGQVVDALWEIVQLGALLSFGTTSDGGTLGITVTVDGRWRRAYCRSEEDLATFVSEALPAVRSALGGPSASPARRPRQRRARGG